MKLTDTHLVILSRASQRDDRGVVLPPTLRGAVARQVVERLVEAGLIEEVPKEGNLVAWRRDEDEQAYALCITPAGLVEIGVDPSVGPPDGRPDGAVSSGMESAGLAKRHGRDGRPAGTSGQAGEYESASAVAAPQKSSPRTGSKTEQLITLLARDGGAPIDHIVSALGWLPHTTRAAITGLRKRGFVIDRQRNEDGVTAYRIVASPPGSETQANGEVARESDEAAE